MTMRLDRGSNDESLTMFRETVRRVLDRELVANRDAIERNGIVHRSFWTAAGEAGLLCPGVPSEWGGLGLDFRFNAVVLEERSYIGSQVGTAIHSDIVAEYIIHYGSPEQKARLLPGMVSGEIVGAIAMTEPDTGSDLKAVRTTARREGDHFILNGTKTYITNGHSADFVIVVAKSDPAKGAKGISLLLVDADAQGFRRGRHLDKIGQRSSDTAELFFSDVRVPCSDVLGEIDGGLPI